VGVGSERGLGPAELVGVPFDRLQQQCAQANDHGRCASAAGDPCAGAGCPLAGARPAPAAQDASRRAFLAAAGKAAGMALATLSAAAGTAPLVAGREEPHAAGQRSGRQRVGYLWEVPVGHAELFELPRSREPAIMVASPRTSWWPTARSAPTPVASSASTPTAARSSSLPRRRVRPRRGAAVVTGPAPRPLPRIELRVDHDAVYVQG
jgi:hypothetical protein